MPTMAPRSLGAAGCASPSSTTRTSETTDSCYHGMLSGAADGLASITSVSTVPGRNFVGPRTSTSSVTSSSTSRFNNSIIAACCIGATACPTITARNPYCRRSNSIVTPSALRLNKRSWSVIVFSVRLPVRAICLSTNQ